MPETVKRCIGCGRVIPEDELICLQCSSENEMQTFRPKIVTNGDRIRAMTDEELAAMIANEYDFCSLCAFHNSETICTKQPTACTYGFYEWLKQEAKDNGQ